VLIYYKEGNYIGQ